MHAVYNTIIISIVNVIYRNYRSYIFFWRFGTERLSEKGSIYLCFLYMLKKVDSVVMQYNSKSEVWRDKGKSNRVKRTSRSQWWRSRHAGWWRSRQNKCLSPLWVRFSLYGHMWKELVSRGFSPGTLVSSQSDFQNVETTVRIFRSWIWNSCVLLLLSFPVIYRYLVIRQMMSWQRKLVLIW
jgi:hypothetical protein